MANYSMPLGEGIDQKCYVETLNALGGGHGKKLQCQFPAYCAPVDRHSPATMSNPRHSAARIVVYLLLTEVWICHQANLAEYLLPGGRARQP